MYIYFSYTKTQKRWLQQCRPKNLAALNYLPCTSKEYIILFCVYTYGLNIYIYIYIFFFLSPPSPLLPVAPLSPQSVLTLFISSRCKLQFLHPSPNQAPGQRRQCRLISSFSAPISLLSHFSSILSLNLSPSQTPKPMIADRG